MNNGKLLTWWNVGNIQEQKEAFSVWLSVPFENRTITFEEVCELNPILVGVFGIQNVVFY